MSEAPILHHYAPATGEYLGSSAADADPVNAGEYLMPAFCTQTAPPAAGEHETAVWQAGAWALVPDYRGHTYWLPDGSRGRVIKLGEAPPAGALEDCPLHRVAADALALIDRQAETARLQFITPGEGQAWTYMRKEREAEAYQADPNPDPANYQLLSACIPGDGADLAAVVVSVLAARDAWLVAGAAIEGIRRAAKTQIEAAPDAAAIQSILDGLTWPQP